MALCTAPWGVALFHLSAWSATTQTPHQLFMVLYMLLLATVVLYGSHRYLLLFIYYRHHRQEPVPARRFEHLPSVTVQLPMFNEKYVAERVIRAVCAMEYPRDKLQIQVLDDSTDETVEIARKCVIQMASLGYDAVYLHRNHRQGFKAGALAEALPLASGEFIAIFDADFVPESDFLLRTIHFFTDPKIGVVQTRWGHINRDNSLLTKSQAMLLDGHFVIEHVARNRSGRFMSFNGTAGIWRRQCIEDAGGWQYDTLTEDLDLSYRAQLKGWNFIYLPEMVSPAELPPEMNAFKVQQYRWTKGAVQTARKMLPAVFRARLPLKVKIEAFFQLTNWVVYPCMVLLTLLLFPAFLIKLSPFRSGGSGQVLFDLTVFNLATVSVTFFYLASQQAIYGRWWDKLKFLPFLMSLGIGICLNNAKAVMDGLFGKNNEFISTPKFGLSGASDRTWKSKTSKPDKKKLKIMPFVELIFGFYLLVCIAAGLLRYGPLTWSLPFLLLFGAGYFYVGVTTFYGHYIAASTTRAKVLSTSPLPAR